MRVSNMDQHLASSMHYGDYSNMLSDTTNQFCGDIIHDGLARDLSIYSHHYFGDGRDQHHLDKMYRAWLCYTGRLLCEVVTMEQLSVRNSFIFSLIHIPGCLRDSLISNAWSCSWITAINTSHSYFSVWLLTTACDWYQRKLCSTSVMPTFSWSS